MLKARSPITRTAIGFAAAAIITAGVLLTPGVAQAAVPTVTSLSVKKGSTDGGTTTLLTGKGFTDASAVEFGSGTAATSFIVLSDTSIAATAPAGTGTVEVLVTTTGGTNVATPTTNDFTYLAPISPTLAAEVSLSSAGGTVFTVPVTASSVASATDITTKKITVTVDGVAATKVAFSATDTLSVTAPAGSPTAVGSFASVNVLRDGVAGTPDATKASYAAVISKLSVTTAPTAGLTLASGKPAITITGVGLTDATAWLFGDEAATCVAASVAKAATSWTCLAIPAHAAGPVRVSFTPALGVLGVTTGATFTYSDLG